MKKSSEGKTKVRVIITVIGLAFLFSGCGMKMEMGGRPLKGKTIAQIQPGKTTKKDIIDLFGTPFSISEPNQQNQAQQMNLGYMGTVVSYKNPFELFTPKHKIVNSYRVYYYYYLRSTMGPILDNMKQYKDELFVLLDESNQLVIDFIYVPDKH